MIGVLLMIGLAVVSGAQGPDEGAGPAGRPRTVVLTDRQNGQNIDLRVGDALILKLPVKLGVGYLWEPVQDDPNVLRPVGEPRVEEINEGHPDYPKLGRTQAMVFEFRAVRPERTTLRLEHVQPFDRSQVLGTFSAVVQVRK